MDAQGQGGKGLSIKDTQKGAPAGIAPTIP